MQGTNLIDHGFEVNDVTVTVGLAKWMTTGSNLCTNVNLTDTAITCLPPVMISDNIRYPTQTTTEGDSSQPYVTVSRNVAVHCLR